MTQEDEELLLIDLCTRLPYDFFVHRYSDNADIRIDNISTFSHFLEYSEGEDFKPYFRPMLSMTEEEVDEFTQFDVYSDSEDIMPNYEAIDWLNKHHFDYRGLIKKGLAIAVTEENNPYKE